jgi:aspartate kinase
MALLSMALNARGVPAVSFTGSQSGIITSDTHTNARIVEVRPYRVQDELERGKVVIVAGYQGVSYRREVTTLGRGGSDTTAVALAAALEAEACEIYSDVDGVYSADPRVVPTARRLSELSYEEMQELAESGAKVLNAQAVEFAKDRGIAIYARATAGGPGETIVRKFPPRVPGRVVGVASESGLLRLTSPSGRAGLPRLLGWLERQGIAGKQHLFEAPAGQPGHASLLLSLENLHDFARLKPELLAGAAGAIELEQGIGAVSAIGAGINASLRNLRRTIELLESAGVPVLGLATSSFRISVLLPEADLANVTRRLHAGLIEAEPTP